MTAPHGVQAPALLNAEPGKIERKKQQTKRTWIAQKNKLKRKFKMLTDSDLRFNEDKKDEMFARLQTKLGKSKDELDEIIALL